MNVNEMKEKAKSFIVGKKWDILLMDAYLQTKYLVSRSKSKDFSDAYSFGIKNINGENKSIDVGYVKNETEFLCGEIKGIKFKLGGYRHSSSMPDGDDFVTTNISFFIDEKRVIGVDYCQKNDDYDAYFADDYRLLSVEEFHNDEKIDVVLKEIHAEKIKQENARKEKEKLEKEEKYKNKFSF